MNATFTSSNRAAVDLRHPLASTLAVVAIVGDCIETAVTYRIYGTSATSYATVKAYSPSGHLLASGNGKAGGGGYHRASAALQNACDAAGITLSEDISGIGESAMRDAMVSIARAAGFTGFLHAVEL